MGFQVLVSGSGSLFNVQCSRFFGFGLQGSGEGSGRRRVVQEGFREEDGSGGGSDGWVEEGREGGGGGSGLFRGVRVRGGEGVKGGFGESRR